MMAEIDRLNFAFRLCPDFQGDFPSREAARTVHGTTQSLPR
jgi:hypothetical protein